MSRYQSHHAFHRLHEFKKKIHRGVTCRKILNRCCTHSPDTFSQWVLVEDKEPVPAVTGELVHGAKVGAGGELVTEVESCLRRCCADHPNP